MNPWQRRFECHYNQRYYVWLAKWYGLATAACEGAIALCSSVTVYLWLQQTHSDWAGLPAVAATILSIVVMTGRLTDKGVEPISLSRTADA